MIVFKCPKCNAVQLFETCINFSSEQCEGKDITETYYCPACRKPFKLTEIESNWSNYYVRTKHN